MYIKCLLYVKDLQESFMLQSVCFPAENQLFWGRLLAPGGSCTSLMPTTTLTRRIQMMILMCEWRPPTSWPKSVNARSIFINIFIILYFLLTHIVCLWLSVVYQLLRGQVWEQIWTDEPLFLVMLCSFCTGCTGQLFCYWLRSWPKLPKPCPMWGQIWCSKQNKWQ